MRKQAIVDEKVIVSDHIMNHNCHLVNKSIVKFNVTGSLAYY